MSLPSTTAIADVLSLWGETGWFAPQLLEIAPAADPIAGAARTITMAPGPEPAGQGFETLYGFIDDARPGDVLVIAGLATIPGAIWGQILSRAAHRSGIRAAIVEGGVRDRELLPQEGVAVWGHHLSTVGAGGQCHVSAIDEAVSVGRVEVTPGDTVVVDGDGVVVLGVERATEVIEAARAYEAAESRLLHDLSVGVPLRVAYQHKRDLVRLLRSEAALGSEPRESRVEPPS